MQNPIITSSDEDENSEGELGHGWIACTTDGILAIDHFTPELFRRCEGEGVARGEDGWEDS